jgi:hypothetical protein
LVAAVLVVRENYNAAFVAAALGAVAWFLNFRSQINPTIVEDAETTGDDPEASDDDDKE